MFTWIYRDSGPAACMVIAILFALPMPQRVLCQLVPEVNCREWVTGRGCKSSVRSLLLLVLYEIKKASKLACEEIFAHSIIMSEALNFIQEK